MTLSFESLTSPERVHRVLAGKLPDRVPVLLQNFQNTAFLSGINLNEFCLNARNMAEAQLAAWETYGYDIIDLENGTAAMAEAMGCEVIYPQNEPPRVTRPALDTLDELGRLKEVDPRRDGHLPELLEATRLVRRGVGSRACIVGEVDQGSFSLSALLLGTELFLSSLLDSERRDDIHKLLDFCNHQIERFALAQFDAGADFVQIGDSLAGPDVCSPQVYESFAFPYERYLALELKRRDISLVVHICGNTTAIISRMALTGAAMLEIDYKTVVPSLSDDLQSRPVLVGNIDPSGVMARGTPETVMEHCRRAIKSMGRHGGFILSPGCTLPLDTPPENTAAMMEAARRYGVYGPDGLIV